MRQSESFSKGIVEIVAKALFRSEKRLEVLLTADVRTRISFFLEDNLTRNNSPIPIETLLHEGLTQQDIATMIGATRQTVAMVLNEMRKDDKIEFNRKEIVVKSRQSIGSA
jgi:CRP-like cAMP-binding protein